MSIFISDTDHDTMGDILLYMNVYQPDWKLSVIDSGKQCLDILRNGICPDAIIVGMQLSDMSGLELTGHIRNDSDVPIIVLSHDRDMRTLVKAFDAGADEYIVKPFNNQLLIARLKALIRRRNWDIRAGETIKECK
jgi:DNA-binding response OmpR family regulator